jgi:hypothetical protein
LNDLSRQPRRDLASAEPGPLMHHDGGFHALPAG